MKIDQSIPSDDKIVFLSNQIAFKFQQEEIHRRYAPVKHVLTFIGVAGVIGLSIVSPSAVVLAKPFLDAEKKKDFNLWKQYNPSFLKRSIKRLHKQKYVEIHNKGGKEFVTLTVSGKRKILKYALDDLTIETPKRWDGLWRIVIYDVKEQKKHLRDIFRGTLKSLGFYQLQESVWVYPYQCEKHIAFLREYYNVGNEVLYVEARKMEDDSSYKEYFGLI